MGKNTIQSNDGFSISKMHLKVKLLIYLKNYELKAESILFVE